MSPARSSPSPAGNPSPDVARVALPSTRCHEEDTLSTPELDPATADSMEQDADFAIEHDRPTFADQHPTGEALEADESTPRGRGGDGGMDVADPS